MIFDTHCHLNSEDLYSKIEQVISEAKKNDVGYFLVVGYDKNSSLLAIKIAETYDFCYAAIGFHPTEIYDLSHEDYDELLKLSKHPKVKAIGEIGLDYYWVKEQEKRDLQKEYFKKQIKLANDLELPIVVHNRDAFKDCLEIIRQNPPKFGGVMHCYSGSVESLNELYKLGLYFGFGGTTTFTNAREPKETATACPLDRLLVETDSPYLTPHPYRGQENQPKYIRLVVEQIAKLKGCSVEKIEDITTENAKRLFKI